MAKWTAFPHLGDYRFETSCLRRDWDRLHAGDAQLLPRDDAVLHAWIRYHAGDFQAAAEAGLKAGTLIGGITHGAKKETALRLFQDGRKLHPVSAIAMIEYANALVMPEGDKKMKEATKLYEQCARGKKMDAMERLHVDLARAELAD